jgi:hypothetical protein
VGAHGVRSHHRVAGTDDAHGTGTSQRLVHEEPPDSVDEKAAGARQLGRLERQRDQARVELHPDAVVEEDGALDDPVRCHVLLEVDAQAGQGPPDGRACTGTHLRHDRPAAQQRDVQVGPAFGHFSRGLDAGGAAADDDDPAAGGQSAQPLGRGLRAVQVAEQVRVLPRTLGPGWLLHCLPRRSGSRTAQWWGLQRSRRSPSGRPRRCGVRSRRAGARRGASCPRAGGGPMPASRQRARAAGCARRTPAGGSPP